MKCLFFSSLLFVVYLFVSCTKNHDHFLKIPLDQYIDKMTGAWIGQMAGVGWGQPTEFKWVDTWIPRDQTPHWNPAMINQHGNDDLYVEMTFLATLEKYGPEVSIRQAGIDFANSEYPLWAANNAGRENLRSGIAPPESSHPAFSKNCDDIDYQIEADYSGIIAPGIPGIPIELGEKFGRLMNYGDGMYAGQFIGGMYSAAFFESDIEKIIHKGLSCIPSQSLYAGCIRDIIKWHRENPTDWALTWQHIEDKYRKSYEFQHFAAQNKSVYVPIDSKLNGAYVVMGLLYGNGNMDSTIVIAMRGGKDSDCNPSNAAGVLGTVIGFRDIPSKFKDSLDSKREFLFSNYNFEELKIVCEGLARKFITLKGGKILQEPDGKEYFLIPEILPVHSAFEPSYLPGKFNENNRYSDEEMTRINAYSSRHFEPVFKKLNLDLRVTNCGKDVVPGIIAWNGMQNVFTTSPMTPNGNVEIKYQPGIIPNGKKTLLVFSAGHDKNTSWKIRIRKDWQTLKEQEISAKNSNNGWIEFKVDLSDWAGREAGDITISAMNVNGHIAKNYWTGFKLLTR